MGTARRPVSDSRRIRTWFGPHLIREYAAPRAQAEAYAQEMPYAFHGLRVTLSESDPGEDLEPLPSERRLWPLTVQ